ncbi:hypothetical protein [Acinetobacter pittii]|uniref:Uncharacterized protein n=1 Tax=Acinetobacter pittii TaxID=48296 RepID=A0A6H0G097_ACIPI|nr:hypothetical protein [Acinetobacter pittii]QIT20006.1 hypothetical protein G8E09_19545 [Acinetobacter pittii]
MNDLKMLIEMAYSEWFILLIYIYLIIAPFILFRNKLKLPKSFFKYLSTGIVTFLFLFYFVIPVPKFVQERQIGYIHNIIDNNDQASTTHLKQSLNKNCNQQYLKHLNAYEYYSIVKGHQLDFKETMENQNVISLGSVGDKKVYSEKKLCDLQNTLNKV